MIERIVNYLKSVRAETARVTWPTNQRCSVGEWHGYSKEIPDERPLITSRIAWGVSSGGHSLASAPPQTDP